MELAEWAESTARELLINALPRRWAHTQGVAAKARALTGLLGEDAELIEAAAWLHDIGYAPGLHDTGFHPLDGARYLRDSEGAEPMLCRMVAHHSCAITEAEERGLAAELIREFRPPPRVLAETLIYCDMTTSPEGQPMPSLARSPVPRRLSNQLYSVWKAGSKGPRARGIQCPSAGCRMV
jgi:predicted hydrolase (HD superfamily)